MSLDALLVPAPLRAAVADGAWIAAMLDAERALASASARAGVIPADAAGRIAAACEPGRFDVEAIVEAGRAAGNPAEPLVRALREAVGAEAAGYVHFGATSQDIVDSAAMLVSVRALALVDAELLVAADACARLAERYRLTPMAARTLLQQAVPTTFGLKAAGWLVAVVGARRRLAGLTEGLPVQLGGAAGTLAAFGGRGPEVVRLYAAELGLAVPLLPWHSERARVAELGSALAVAAGACAKIGTDVALLEQTEVGEVREPAGAGASSTMPQKRNPVGSVVAVACYRRAQASAQLLLGGLAGEHERGLGTWQVEWGALSDGLAAAGGAATAIADVLVRLEPQPGRMRENLELRGGAVMSERLAFLLGARAGHARAREIVAAAAERASRPGGSLREALAGMLPEAELEQALDPATYLGAADDLVAAALDDYRKEAEWTERANAE